MLANNIVLDWNGNNVTLTKIREGGFSSSFFGEFVHPTAGTVRRFNFEVKHTLPNQPNGGDSHLVRLDVEYYDDAGVYQKTTPIWTVVQSKDRSTNVADLQHCNNAMKSIMTDAFAGQIGLYES